MSQVSKPGIADTVGFRRPLAEGRERVIDQLSARFAQNNAIAFDEVGNLVTFDEPKRVAHRQRYGRLRFAGQFAGDHRPPCKEFPYQRQVVDLAPIAA
jgi:hypothetical protein